MMRNKNTPLYTEFMGGTIYDNEDYGRCDGVYVTEYFKLADSHEFMLHLCKEFGGYKNMLGNRWDFEDALRSMMSGDAPSDSLAFLKKYMKAEVVKAAKYKG